MSPRIFLRLRVIQFAAPFVLLATFQARSQPATPAISKISNAASFNSSVAPGSIAAIVGNLTGASTAPDLAVLFNGATSAPLLFVSDTQINIQIPWELSGQSQVALTVTINGQTSDAQPVDLIAYAPGIFNTNGQGSIVDESNRLVDSTNPATPGSTIVIIYCTGLGSVSNTPATGQATPILVPSPTRAVPSVTIGGVPAQIFFSGLAPGFTGEYKISARVPSNTPPGTAVPVTIAMAGFTSNVATINVQPRDPKLDSDERATQLVAQMTQDEKIQLLEGISTTPDYFGGPIPRGAAGFTPAIPRLGIPALYLADGPTGAGDSIGPATALPSSMASAAGWDLNGAYQYGRVIGAELRAYGINVNLGGNVNLTGREPRDGRTFETKGEDPVLAGRIGAAHIRGVQDQHVIGGIKHFALNDQESGRTTADAQIDERGARESDLLAFEIGIKDSNVQSVMCAYNQINEVYSCENPHLLNDVLKHDWGFPGFVMSDWWATHSLTAAVLAGLDQEMPNQTWFGGLKNAVQNGQIPQSRLDDMAHRVVRAMSEVGLLDYPEALGPIDKATDQAIAQQTEEQGAVLLKNDGGQLPLDPAAVKSIAIIGAHADVAVLSGGGSAQVYPTGAYLSEGTPCPPCWAPLIWDPSSPLNAIQAIAQGATVSFDNGSDPSSAAVVAGSSQVAIVFLNQWTSEGMDLDSLSFVDLRKSPPAGEDALVTAVAAANPNTIVVLENGGPMVMPWLANVPAVLEAWYPGQKGGEAIANLLFGVVNPSGKLPMTFPASVTDLPRPVIPQPPNATDIFPVNYSEGLLVGYKWYDSQGLTPLFPFGFGLSYTTFSIANPQITGGNAGFQVNFDLQNTGSRTGAEVAQVYLGFLPGTGEPPKRLLGWQKVQLDPGALQHVSIPVNLADSSHPMGYWDTSANDWLVALGDYEVYLGTSSGALQVIGVIRASQGDMTFAPPSKPSR